MSQVVHASLEIVTFPVVLTPQIVELTLTIEQIVVESDQLLRYQFIFILQLLALPLLP